MRGALRPPSSARWRILVTARRVRARHDAPPEAPADWSRHPEGILEGTPASISRLAHVEHRNRPRHHPADPLGGPRPSHRPRGRGRRPPHAGPAQGERGHRRLRRAARPRGRGAPGLRGALAGRRHGDRPGRRGSSGRSSRRRSARGTTPGPRPRRCSGPRAGPRRATTAPGTTTPPSRACACARPTRCPRTRRRYADGCGTRPVRPGASTSSCTRR